MVARKYRRIEEVPPDVLEKLKSMGEDRTKWGYVPSGMPVWAVIGDIQAYDGDMDRLVSDSGGVITREDIEFAQQYYKAHPGEIDRKLDQTANW